MSQVLNRYTCSHVDCSVLNSCYDCGMTNAGVHISRIRSGGQTGADRGALDAARAAGVPICGWCPKGGWSEDYPEPPGLLASYPELQETPSADPIQRTEWNVRDSDATLIVCPGGLDVSPGTAATARFAERYRKPLCVVEDANEESLEKVRTWLATLDTPIELNVAGPRESESPGTYECTLNLVQVTIQSDCKSAQASLRVFNKGI